MAIVTQDISVEIEFDIDVEVLCEKCGKSLGVLDTNEDYNDRRNRLDITVEVGICDCMEGDNEKELKEEIDRLKKEIMCLKFGG